MVGALKTRNHELDEHFWAKTLLIEGKKKKKNDDIDTGEGGSDDEESFPFVEKVGVSVVVEVEVGRIILY